MTDRAQHLAPRHVVTLVRAAFDDAVVDHLIPLTPFQRIALPRVARHRIVPLTVEQVRAVVEVIGRPATRAQPVRQQSLRAGSAESRTASRHDAP
jgi:hypothetical protein